ncbi:hypothetical protein LUZ60_000122 [Juncus effusus]|nr:hypothetical protein LUZ60_000122 [Juncus effusus]
MDYQQRNHSAEPLPAVHAIPIPPAPKYVALANHNLHQYKRQDSQKKKCTLFLHHLIAFIFLLMLILFLLILCFFTFLKLRLPTYTVSSIEVSSIHVNPAFPNVTTNLTVLIDSQNSNKRVWVQYRPGGRVVLYYRGENLCTGEIQEFTQPSENMTRIKVNMNGQTEAGPGVRAALMESIAGQEKADEGLRLIILIRLPITIRFDEKMAIGRLRMDIDSTVDVDNVMPGRKIRIIHSNYEVKEDYFH